MENRVFSSLEQNREVTLLDILDGILDKGVVIAGELVISVANIDLVSLDLRILVSSVETVMQKQIQTKSKNLAKGVSEEWDRHL